jgi:putative alpha-1,2-mannosidase
MAKAVADTDSDSRQGGFTTDGANITGFSSMHDSGTGGNPSLGLWPLFPYANCANDEVDGCRFPKKERATQFKNESLKASPGYFSLELNSGVTGEMTAAAHTSLFKFSFPDGSSPLVFLDLSDLSDSRQDNATISVQDNGHMTGSAVFQPSFGQDKYTAYFCADFQGNVRDTGIYVNSRGSTTVKDLKVPRSINGYPLPAGAFVRFQDGNPVTARVGLSFISSEQACQLAENEIPDFDFEGTHQKAVSEWKQKMSPITVESNGVDDSFLKNFYSGIYRTFMNPQDYTGVQDKVSADTIYFDSFYWYVCVN